MAPQHFLITVLACAVAVNGFAPRLPPSDMTRATGRGTGTGRGRGRGTAPSISTSTSSMLFMATPPSNNNKKKNSIARVAVKPRPFVRLDQDTGMYIQKTPNDKADLSPPEASTSASASASASTVQDKDMTMIDEMSGFGAFKDGIYSFFDGVSNVATINSGKKKKPTNRILNRSIDLGYSDIIINNTNNNNPVESSSQAQGQGGKDKDNAAPGQKLMQKYKQATSTSTTATANNPLSLKKEDISDGDNLFQSDIRKSFDSAKDTFYGTIDSVTNTITSTTRSTSTSTSTRNTSTKSPISTHEPFKVASKPSINKADTVTNLSTYAADSNSSNPLTRIKANFAIAAEERMRKRRIEQLKRRQTIDNIKQIIFDFVESIQSIYEIILTIPSQVEKGLEGAQYALEETVIQAQNTMGEIQKTPLKLQQAVEDTKKNVRETQRVTMDAVQEVQALPKKVQQSFAEYAEEVQAIPTRVDNKITETRRSIEETKQGVDRLVQQAQGLVLEVKIIAGLAERPPRPPPPPRTTEEFAKAVAVGVAKETASLAGKAGVVVAKGTAGMAVSGAKLAWQAATSAKEKEGTSSVEKNAAKVPVAPKVISTIPKREKPTTIGDIDPLLEREVAEALRVAELALSVPKQAEPVPVVAAISKAARPKAVGIARNDIDINQAVKRAREAAARASNDAAELEAMLNDRNYFIEK